MALLDFLRRRSSSGGVQAIGLGDDDGDLEVGEGGPSIFRREIAEYRWAAQHEAVNVARRGIAPERWADARMGFEFERALAHDHEALRDRLANHVSAQVRDSVTDLYSLANDVGVSRGVLLEADRDYLSVRARYEAANHVLEHDALEVSRYYRARSQTTVVLKYLIAALFVLGEFVISGIVFENLFAGLPQGLGYLLALGVTVALVVVPHYTAMGLKQGYTQHHTFEIKNAEQRRQRPNRHALRAAHFEERDDQGFRLLAAMITVILFLTILPLSVLRAQEDGEESVSYLSVAFLLLLQLLVSGYFFLREWLDYGPDSASLKGLREDKERVQAAREGAEADHGDAWAAYHSESEVLLHHLSQAARYDSMIVENYLATVHYFRHLLTLEHPEYEEFITWARVPYLGPETDLKTSNYPLDPTSREHRSLDESGPVGRAWSSSRLSSVQEKSDPADKIDWQILKSPEGILTAVLRDSFGFPYSYVRPTALKDAELLTQVPGDQQREGASPEEAVRDVEGVERVEDVEDVEDVEGPASPEPPVMPEPATVPPPDDAVPPPTDTP